VSIAIPYVKENKVRALAVTSLQRTALMPEVPTIAESGLPGYEVSNWYAVLGPAGMQASLVKRLHDALTVAQGQPAMRKRVQDLGADTVAGPPEQLAAYIKTEIAKWSRVIRDAGIKPD
jgi:tripartite-type tricarboxylate transporter receptor subunit TctC